MSRSSRLFALFPAHSVRRTARRLTLSAAALLAPLALLALATSPARAQGSAAPAIALHVPVSHFEFVASGDTQPAAKPLVVHNGGTVRLTDVRLTRLSYADSARGAGWLVAIPRQSAVSPDELATVGMLCVDATGLSAGTYHAAAAVGARELPEPVALTITFVVAKAGARARHAPTRCGAAVAK